MDAAHALIDWTPLLRLLGLAAVIALLPLSWWWLRQHGAPLPRKLAALTALILFLTIDLIVVGAFTRLTDSGLGCPDWPGCYGELTPWGAKAEISAAQAAQPTGPVTHGKAWIEMVHRYLAMAVGALILVAAAMSPGAPGPSCRTPPGGPRPRCCGCWCRARSASTPSP
jgi:cytochrome c oxidase assembly protein subunit 15